MPFDSQTYQGRDATGLLAYLDQRVLHSALGRMHLRNALGILFMSVNAAIERTEKQWYDLIESAGLKLDRIWTFEPDSESILEVTFKE